MLKLLYLCVFFKSFCCHVFDYPSTKLVTVNNSFSGAYFGYSILLQRGDPPLAIVGAPRQIQYNRKIGAVYKCDLNKLSCEIYKKLPNIPGLYVPEKNGDFLGAAIDGVDRTSGHFYTCSPRFTTEINNGYYYTNGKCFFIKNSNYTNAYSVTFAPMNSFDQTADSPFGRFYDAAFAECGLDLLYLQEKQELLIGAPGKSFWNGAIVKRDLRKLVNQLISFKPSFKHFHDNYYGYAVSWGRFLKNSSNIWYVSGGPRGDDLKGHVLFFESSYPPMFALVKQLSGEEVGSYFGASLLTVHSRDGGDDILIGAPMFSGNTFEEGCVYYYRNRGDSYFEPPLKLINEKMGSRFGLVMQNLGDIDLDSYLDVAISAPYENGIGAVYIYFGSINGFNNDNFYKITPSNFANFISKPTIRGFGLGLSKGNDIDDNGHNDLVVGAYLSSQIFVFTTKTQFDISSTLKTDPGVIYTISKNFIIEFCIIFFPRNGRTTSKIFSSELVLNDERVKQPRRIVFNTTLLSGRKICKQQLVTLNSFVKTTPIIATIRHQMIDGEKGEFKKLEIPVSYECGNDNICNVDLSITAKEKSGNPIVFGATTDIEVEVTLQNVGEVAYDTTLILRTPKEINLINMRECEFANESYVCLMPQFFREKVVQTFKFDISSLQHNQTRLNFDFSITSLGVDVNKQNNQCHLEHLVVSQTSPYIDSNVYPEFLMVAKENDTSEVKLKYILGNTGPSPLSASIIILIPQLTFDNNEVFEVDNIEGSDYNLRKYNISNSDLGLEENNTLNITINSHRTIQILFNGDYFVEPNEILSIIITINVNLKVLKDNVRNYNKIFFTGTAILNNGTEVITSEATILLYGFSERLIIPIWAYIVSVVGGICLLCLVIFGLYKCNFFSRSYKELLENELHSGMTEPLHEQELDEVFRSTSDEDDD